MSKAIQRASVAEGLALGVVALGVESFNESKMKVEFAFQHAWRDWIYRAVFPAVRAQVDRNDLLGILGAHPRQRSGTGLVGWESSWPFEPHLEDDWSVEEVGALLESSTGVPLAGWIGLAKRFLGELEA